MIMKGKRYWTSMASRAAKNGHAASAASDPTLPDAIPGRLVKKSPPIVPEGQLDAADVSQNNQLHRQDLILTVGAHEALALDGMLKVCQCHSSSMALDTG